MKSQTLVDITQRNVNVVAQMERASECHRTPGERVADWIAAWVGSWSFLIFQTLLMVAWIVVNVTSWVARWDPYPFVLLNLILSFQAAYATPIILMSQNRQSRLSERRNRLDLQINLLAEQENTEQLRLLRLLCERASIDITTTDETAFEEATQPEEIVREISEACETNLRDEPRKQ